VRLRRTLLMGCVIGVATYFSAPVYRSAPRERSKTLLIEPGPKGPIVRGLFAAFDYERGSGDQPASAALLRPRARGSAVAGRLRLCQSGAALPSLAMASGLPGGLCAYPNPEPCATCDATCVIYARPGFGPECAGADCMNIICIGTTMSACCDSCVEVCGECGAAGCGAAQSCNFE
jgi:hypothetical protein